MPAAPTLDGTPATGTFSTTNIGTAALTTSLSNDVIVVLITLETIGGANSVSNVTSPGLSFQKRTAQSFLDSNGQFGQAEIWWAPSTGLLAAAVITVQTTVNVDDAAFIAFGVNGAANINSPWDNNAGLPFYQQANTGAPSLSFSTTQADNFIFKFLAMGYAPTFGSGGWTNLADNVNSGGTNYAAAAAEYETVTSVQTGVTATWSGLTPTTNPFQWLVDAITSNPIAGGAPTNPDDQPNPMRGRVSSALLALSIGLPLTQMSGSVKPFNLNDQPNPVLRQAERVENRTHLISLVGTTLRGQDRFFDGAGQGPDYDYPNPRLPVVQRQDFSSAPFDLIQPQPPKPYNQTEWPNPRLGRALLPEVGPPSLAVTEAPIYLLRGPFVTPRWAPPSHAAVSSGSAGVPLPVLITIPLPPTPFSQSDWPNPRAPWRSIDPLVIGDTTLAGPIQPSPNFDQPNPLRRVVARQDFIASSFTRTPPVQPPFFQADWPNPLGQPARLNRGFDRSAFAGKDTMAVARGQTADQPNPTLARNSYLWRDFTAAGLVLGQVAPTPFLQTDWPNPRLSRWIVSYEQAQPVQLKGADATTAGRLLDQPNPRLAVFSARGFELSPIPTGGNQGALVATGVGTFVGVTGTPSGPTIAAIVGDGAASWVGAASSTTAVTAAGVGVLSGVANAAPPGVLTATGVGSVAGVGAGTAASVATIAGTGTANWIPVTHDAVATMSASGATRFFGASVNVLPFNYPPSWSISIYGQTIEAVGYDPTTRNLKVIFSNSFGQYIILGPFGVSITNQIELSTDPEAYVLSLLLQ